MRTHPHRPSFVLSLTCLLAILLFFLDIAVPQAHLWGSYLLPIVLTFLWGRRRDIYLVTALASLLVVATFWTDGTAAPEDLVINHLLPLGILWAVAWLLAQRRQQQERLDKQVIAHATQLDKIFRANPGGIAISRLSDGCFLDANPAYLQMLGYARDELVGRTSVDLGILSAAARAQIVDRVNRQAVAAPFAAQLRTKTGATIDIMTAIDTIDFVGEPCLLTMAADVTAAKQLEARANHLSALVTSSPDAIVGRTVDGTILSWNHGAEQIFGYAADEAIGQNLTMLSAADSLAQMQVDMAAVAQGHSVEDHDTQRMAKNGRVFDCRVSMFPVRDHTGEIVGVASFTHDISERKAAEQTLRDSEARFVTTFNANPIGLCIMRAADATYIDANPAYLAMLGFAREELIGRTPVDLGIVTAAANAEQAVAWRARGAALTIDAYLFAKDGRRIDIVTSVNMILLGGEPCRLIVAFDITERKQLEATVSRLAAIVESSSDAIASTDLQGRVVNWNRSAEQMFSCSAGEAIGRPINELLPLGPDTDEGAIVARVRSGNTVLVADSVMTKADGTTVDLSIVLSPVNDNNGAVVGMASIVRDITARKRLEAELQASVERWNMAAEISSIGVWDWRAGSDQVIWDERMYLLHGVAPGTAVTFAAWRALIHPDDRAAVEANSRKSGRERTRMPVEYRVVLPDGSLRYLLSIGGGLYDESGTPVRQLGITLDITARKRAEVALAESESRLRAVIENTEDSIWSVDAGCCFLVGNSVFVRKGQQQIGRPLAVGDCVLDAPFPPTTRAFWQPLYDRAFGGESFTLEMSSGLNPGGTLAIYLNPIYAADGTIVGVTGRATDITARKQMEEALVASERKYRDLYDNSPDMYMSGYPADHLIRDCNLALARTLGYTREDLIGRPNSFVFTSASHTHMLAELPQYAAAGEYANLEVQLQCKDGTVLDALMSGQLDPAATNRPAYSRVTLHDITERKRTEAELAASEAQLRESQARYQMLADHATDVIWSMDPAGKVTYVSPSSVRQSGFTPEEAMCQTLEETFAPSSRTAVRAAVGELCRLIRSGQPAPATPNVYELLRKDGTTYWGETIYSAVYNEQGEFQQLIGATREVTKRVHAERKLREAYQRVQLAAGAAGLGIWNWNFVDNSLEWDDRMCELYGVTAEERRAGIFYDLWRSRVHPDDLALAESAQGDPTLVGDAWSGAYRIVLPGGEVRHIQAMSVTEYEPDGKPRRIIGVNRDITDQIRYEQLLQDTNTELEDRVAARTVELQTALNELQRAGTLKDEFMAMISHELRTPLTGVLSMSEMLEDQIAGPLNARQATYVKCIVQSGERLLNVINGILTYTHLLSGKFQLHTEPCDLTYLLDICAAALGHRAAERQQTIAVQVTPPNLAIMSDATALAEVLKRLLDNAVKFTPEGGRIGLEGHPGVVPNTVDLLVWDTGIGIAPDQTDQVFHAFTQADARLSRSHEGIGLGLAYVHQMVHLMGGIIALASTPGEGSRFTITLPASK